jgi:hypothetical protein
MGNNCPWFIDLTGKTFGRYLVIKRGMNCPDSRSPRWWCTCSCGKVSKLIRGQHLRKGTTLSCGCLIGESAKERFTTHGVHGTAQELMLRSARGRAKRSNIPFNITLVDIVIPDVCPLLGIPIKQNLWHHGPSPNSPTLDRRVTSLGYVRGNVWVISHKANTIKSNATVEELERLIEGLRRAL